jgi:hypothetical protein
MDRFMGKFFILVLLVASLSGATLLSPKQDAGSGPGVTPGAMSLERGAGMFGQNLPGPSELRQYTAGGHVLGFRPGGVIIASGSHALRVEFVNARPVSPVEEGTSSGLAKGQGHAPELGKVTYRNLWDGVTAVFEKTESGVVKSTYSIEPGEAEASQPVDEIRLRYNVPVKIDRSGDLLLSFGTGEMRETRPVAWQEVLGRRVALETTFRLLGEREVGFKVGAYDPRYPLVIDPALSWNTFLGGWNNDEGRGIAVDASGNSYVTGRSYASWGSPIRAFTNPGTAYYDAFVAKLDTNGALQWNTFLGGSNYDIGWGIAVDASGNSYVTGDSYASWGSPVRPFVVGIGGQTDAFVAKLAANGALQWNTFLGESDSDRGNGIAADTTGNCYVTGYSETTWGSPLLPFAGFYDAFVAKLDTNGALQWNTFLGGSDADSGLGIAVDTSGNSYVTGDSCTTWGDDPIRDYTPGEYYPDDGFVAKLNTNGTLQWNTFLGGSGKDIGEGIAVDTSGNSYVTGMSDATWGDNPVNAFVAGYDAFVAKLDTTGTMQWHTFLGGSSHERGYGIAVNANGNSYVTGDSRATWGSPLLPFAGGLYDAFVAKLGANGALQWNTFLGGNQEDHGYGIDVDTSGNSYVTGLSYASWGSPIRAFTNPNTGYDNAFVAKIGNGIRVDFNNDGQEDILWRYYGTGGYNRAWFLGDSGQAGLPLAMGGSPMAVVGAGARSTKSPRAIGVRPDRSPKIAPRTRRGLMGDIAGRTAGLAAIPDPRLAGGSSPQPAPAGITDPRLAGLALDRETSSDRLAAIASTPVLLGGADLLPVGDVYWWIVGMADFNNDSQVDILWRNMSSGSNVVWFMNGTEWAGSAELLPVSDLYWEIVGTGDFNNDTHADILWRNIADGSNVIWYMEGTTWIGSAVLLGVSDLAWEIAGTGDFNNDGHVDILWRYNQYGGYNVVWYMNDAAWTGSAELISVADLSWEIASTGDYNNDGRIDILWRYMWTGSTYIWYMDGVTWIGGGDLLQVSDTTWKLVPGCRIW